ncbi:MAG: M15 family metallopeptidase [Bacteriovoracaceae bacterium]|nr:M15 family metallopeptidase [Bacteriovoracaceae bacterium]
MISSDLLTGKNTEHLTSFQQENEEWFLHKEALPDFLNLKKKAAQAGFDIHIASAFRDYDRQLLIWNEKACGKRILRGNLGEILDFKKLSPAELMFAILRWSAFPGASRHHWGTDIDIFPVSHLPQGAEPQMIPQESEVGGIFYDFHQWLSQQITKNKSFGFFRPYAHDLGGVAPEMWHLSYAPLSTKYFKYYNLELFESLLENNFLELRDVVLKNKKLIFEQFVTNIVPPPF